jgi:hypothetical protein
MMTKFTIVLSTLFLAMTGINAQRGGPRGGGGGGGGGRPAPGSGGQRPGQGGPRPGGPFNEDSFVDLSNNCTDVDPAEPACALMNGEAGTWLCRTLFEPTTGESESWSTCGNTTRALPLDECGCCDGICPTPCTCDCVLEGDSGAGVLVGFTKQSGESGQECMVSEKAISVIAKPGGRAQCVTECPAT